MDKGCLFIVLIQAHCSNSKVLTFPAMGPENAPFPAAHLNRTDIAITDDGLNRALVAVATGSIRHCENIIQSFASRSR